MASPHESAQTSNLDTYEAKRPLATSVRQWVSSHKITASIIAGFTVLGLVGGGYAVLTDNSDDPYSHAREDAGPQREWADVRGQTELPEPRILDNVARGNMATVDNDADGARVEFSVVGVDGIGGVDGATLAPPQNVSQVGYYVRSAPFGSDGEGTSVITSHIDFNGTVGAGSVFTSLVDGDPVTMTDDKGNEFHYQVTGDPVNLNKEDPEYVNKTMDSINRMEGKNTLVIITCGGNYIPGSPLGYEDNIIIEAELVSD